MESGSSIALRILVTVQKCPTQSELPSETKSQIAFLNILSIISIIPSHLTEDEAGGCRTAVGSLKSTAP